MTKFNLIKRTVLIAFLTLAVLLPLASCGKNETNVADVEPKAIVEAASAAYDGETLPQAYFYVSGTTEGQDEYLDPDTAGLYFYGEFAADMTAFTGLEAYALRFPATKRVFEIDVLKATDEGGVGAAKALLEARLAQKNNGEIANYAPEEQPYLDAAEIYTVGRYAILVATTDNSVAKGVIAGMLGSAPETSASETDTQAPPPQNAPSGDVVDFASETEVPYGDSGDTGGQQSEAVIDDTGRTPLPEITFLKHIESDVVVIGGSCSEASVIHIRGGAEEVTLHNDHGSFVGMVKLNRGLTTVIHVTALEDGLEESRPYIITALERNGVDYIGRMGGYHHIYGDYLQSFTLNELEDFTGASVMSDRQIAAATNKIEGRVDYLAGIDCELVYLIIPTPMHIYPEWVPKEYVEYKGERRLDQFEKLATEAGATVINLYDVFMEHKSDEFKLFHRTDTHWSAYGAYFGYRELMSHVSLKWPDAAPRPSSDFTFYSEWCNMGDIAEHTESDPALLREYATFVKFNFDNEFATETFYKCTCRLDHGLMSMQITTKNKQSGNLSLPTAYILRDSFGTPIYSYLSDAFSSVYWESMWSYDFNKSKIMKFSPDYFIYIVTERNLGNVIA